MPIVWSPLTVYITVQEGSTSQNSGIGKEENEDSPFLQPNILPEASFIIGAKLCLSNS